MVQFSENTYQREKSDLFDFQPLDKNMPKCHRNTNYDLMNKKTANTKS